MERIYFPSFDGEEISLLLARPEAAEARPCVVFLHGGAWRFGLADSYARHAEYAVSRGAVDLTGRLNRELFGPCDMQTVQPDEWLEKYRAGGRGLAASAGRAGQRARDPYARPERRNHLPLRNRPAP